MDQAPSIDNNTESIMESGFPGYNITNKKFIFYLFIYPINLCDYCHLFMHNSIIHSTHSGSMCPIDLKPVPGGGFYLPFRLLSVDWVAKNANKYRNKSNFEAKNNPLKMPDCDLIITFVSPHKLLFSSTIFVLLFK